MGAGKFVWQELITPDIATARAFYADLLGWDIRDVDMGPIGSYPMIHVDGTPIGGFDRSDGSDAGPHWLPYIEVPDTVETASEAAVTAGGDVIRAAQEIPGVGRGALLADPEGALFMAFEDLPENKGVDAPVVWPPPPGAVSWYAVGTSDGRKAAEFYAAVFGYDAIDSPQEGTPDDYLVLTTGETMHAGVMTHGGTMPSQWLLYFAVAGIHVTLAKAVEMGGQATTPVVTIPGLGKIAGLIDPTGALFFVHQPE
jgi:predicted enzyme related to lactoylglutathione lyase